MSTLVASLALEKGVAGWRSVSTPMFSVAPASAEPLPLAWLTAEAQPLSARVSARPPATRAAGSFRRDRAVLGWDMVVPLGGCQLADRVLVVRSGGGQDGATRWRV